MASHQASAAVRLAVVDRPPRAMLPRPDKLDRLRELRAAIDSLRFDREAHDPLMAWILEREKDEVP